MRQVAAGSFPRRWRDCDLCAEDVGNY